MRPLARALGNVVSVLVFGVAPVALVSAFLAVTFGSSTFAYDFHGGLYNAAVAILHGRDPYDAALLSHLAALPAAGTGRTPLFSVPVYPAPTLLAVVPFGLLPFKAAGLAFAGLSLIAFGCALRLFGVRDWRCFGAALLSWPLVYSLRLGQVNELLLLAVALAWRFRRRTVPAALATAAAVTAKLFLWPFGVYLLLARRVKAAAIAGAAAVLACGVGWAVVGFGTLGSYPHILGDESTINGPAGVSILSLGAALGIGRTVATAAGLALAGTLLIGAERLARDPDTDRHAFALAAVAALAASPVAWPHYLVLLYAPIALLSPRLGPLWAVPLLAWAAPVGMTDRSVTEILPYIAIELVVAAAAARPLLAASRPRAALSRCVPAPGRRLLDWVAASKSTSSRS